MQLLDWIILATTLIFIVVYGIYKTRKNNSVQDYIRGGNEAKWWTIGLSVMATQASAITFLSTPGQAFHSGMGFAQFYFGLPLAMVIICLVFLPIYHKLKVYTAYEYLEGRFDLKTRSLAAILFLIQRGLAAGITIYAPAIILSAVLGWDLVMLIMIIGLVVIVYTVSGGTKAVSITQKQQMAIIFIGMFITFFLVLDYLPEGVGLGEALSLAGANSKMDILDFSFDFENRYTVWSGLIGGTFLMLSYFGTDQSQVQRYLSGKSLREMRLGLIFNGLLKVPMQFFILLVGVLVFVFYQFNPAPLHFNPKAQQVVENAGYANDFNKLESKLNKNQKWQKGAAFNYIQNPDLDNKNNGESYIEEFRQQNIAIREEAKDLITRADPDFETNDKDYVFIHFILNNLPRGLIGLLLAVILSAAMSSTASELNALGATTTIDLYKRNLREEKEDKHYVKASKLFTLLWGGLAIIFACSASLFENLIELVNIIGSIFYGNILGIFLLAFFIKWVKGNAVFMAGLFTQAIVTTLYIMERFDVITLPYLWLNLIGCAIVMGLAILFQTALFKNGGEKQIVSS